MTAVVAPGTTIRQQIVALVKAKPGLTNADVSAAIGRGVSQNSVEMYALAKKGLLRAEPIPGKAPKTMRYYPTPASNGEDGPQRVAGRVETEAEKERRLALERSKVEGDIVRGKSLARAKKGKIPMPLSRLEQVLEYVRGHSGCSSVDVARDMGLPDNAAAAALHALHVKKVVKRAETLSGPIRFRYRAVPKNKAPRKAFRRLTHRYPAHAEQPNRKVVKKRPLPNLTTRMAMEEARRIAPRMQPTADLMLMIPYGGGKTLQADMDEARDIYIRLKPLFERG